MTPKRPIDWILAAALLFLPLAPFLNTFSALGTALRLLIAVAAALLILTGRIPLARPLLGRGRWLIVVFALVQLVPLIGAVTADFGLVRAVNWTMFVPLAFIAYDRRSQRTAIAFATLAGVALLAGLLLQAVDVLSGTWAGYVLSDGTPATRYTSLLLNPNDLGLFALSLGVVLGLVSRGGDRRVRAAGLCSVVACGLVVSLTHSRGALLVAAAVLLYLLVAGVAWRSLAQLSAAATVGILVIPLALPSTRESAAVTLESLAAIVGGDDRSSSVRADRWSRLTGGEGIEVAESQARNGLPSWTVSSTASAAATTEQRRDGSLSAGLVRKRDGRGAQPIFLGSPVGSVRPGLTYTAAGHCRPQRTSRPCRVMIIFRDARGKDLRPPISRQVMSRPGEWTRISITDGAPAGTVQAEVRGVILGVPEGEAHYLDSFLLIRGPARSLLFTEERGDPLGLGPVPISGPAPKASTESPSRNGLPSWTVSSTASAASTTEQHRDGSRSARLVRKRDGRGTQPIFLASPVESVKPGLTYTVAGHCRPQRTPRPCRALIIFRDARGRVLLAPVSRQVMSRPGRWTRVRKTYQAPAGTVEAEVRGEIFAVSEGETHYLDSFLLIRGPADSLPFTEGRDDPLGLAPVPISAPAPKASAGEPRLNAVASSDGLSGAAHGAIAAAQAPARAGASEGTSPPGQGSFSGQLTAPEIVFGAGYGGYAQPETLSRFELANQQARRKAQIRATVDNGWLKLFLEEGLLGTGVFLAIFAAALWRSFSARRTAQRVLGLTTGALLVALGVRALSADVLDINPWNFLVWLLVGLAFTATSEGPERAPNLAQTPR